MLGSTQRDMKNQSDNAQPVRGLDGIDRAPGKGLPPVHLWHPDNCRDIDMRIARDGTWFYQGSPIGREAMVRLFSTILRRDDDDRYYLVTPVEKCGIEVADVPFVATRMEVMGSGADQNLEFTSNVGDVATAGKAHPLRFETGSERGVHIPYICMRDRLDARIGRAVYYDLIDCGSVHRHDDADWFGVWSGGCFWPIAPADEIGLG